MLQGGFIPDASCSTRIVFLFYRGLTHPPDHLIPVVFLQTFRAFHPTRVVLDGYERCRYCFCPPCVWHPSYARCCWCSWMAVVVLDRGECHLLFVSRSVSVLTIWRRESSLFSSAWSPSPSCQPAPALPPVLSEANLAGSMQGKTIRSQHLLTITMTYTFTREETIIVNRVLREDPSKSDMHNRQPITPKLLWKSLKDYDLWPIYILGLTFQIPTAPQTSYLTLTLKGLGFDTFSTNLLTIPSTVGHSECTHHPKFT